MCAAGGAGTGVRTTTVGWTTGATFAADRATWAAEVTFAMAGCDLSVGGLGDTGAGSDLVGATNGCGVGSSANSHVGGGSGAGDGLTATDTGTGAGAAITNAGSGGCATAGGGVTGPLA